jgi:hypothetical protein
MANFPSEKIEYLLIIVSSVNDYANDMPAIGLGWHLPSATEWTNFQYAENINDEFSAFESGSLFFMHCMYNRLMDKNGILQPGCTNMQNAFRELGRRLEF